MVTSGRDHMILAVSLFLLKSISQVSEERRSQLSDLHEAYRYVIVTLYRPSRRYIFNYMRTLWLIHYY